MQYIITDIAEELGLYPKGPTCSTPGSAGIDLYYAGNHKLYLHCGVPTEIPTGLHLWVNDDSLAMLLLPRSSSGFRLTNTIGLIDSDYQGEIIMRALANSDDQSVVIHPGDKIGQLVILSVVSPTRIAFTHMDSFSANTVRGVGRHGSTGK